MGVPVIGTPVAIMDEMTTPTSPELPTDDLVKTKKEYADLLTQDMTDDEITKSFNIIIPIIQKWQERFVRRANSYPSVEAAMEDLEKFEDELKYECATRLKIYVTVDCLPVLEGEPPVIVVQGPLEDHIIHKYGFDHEKKGYEVTHATRQGEAFQGETKKHKRKKNEAPRSSRKLPST
jgi:hypothetical protein